MNLDRIDLTKSFSFLEIIKLLREYDAYHGDYPESQYEGRAVTRFLITRLFTDGYAYSEETNAIMKIIDGVG